MKKIILLSLSLLMMAVGTIQPAFGMEGHQDRQGEHGEAADAQQPVRFLPAEGRPQAILDVQALEDLSNNRNTIIRKTANYREKERTEVRRGKLAGFVRAAHSWPFLMGGAALAFVPESNFAKFGIGLTGFIFGAYMNEYKTLKPAFLENPENDADLNHAEKRDIKNKFYKNAFNTDVATTSLLTAATIGIFSGAMGGANTTTEKIKTASCWLPAIYCATYAVKYCVRGWNKAVARGHVNRQN